MSRLRLATVFLSIIALVIVTTGGTQPPNAASGGGPGGPGVPTNAPYVPGELLVGFKASAMPVQKAGLMSQVNALQLRSFESGAEHWRLGLGQTVEGAIAALKANPQVLYAEPNYILTADVLPNDPRFQDGSLYGLRNTGQNGGLNDADIDAEMAWDVSRGSRDVLVGVIDTGIDYNHPDLAANIWTNPAEDPANGGQTNVDDDNNGFVDDIHGYDFANNDGNPFDDNGHGTHTAGTIGAVGNNNLGVVGVNWEVTLMAIKFLNAGGSGTTAGAIASVEYATMMGVDLTSNSWGGGGFSTPLRDAIAAAGDAEIGFIAAAGNSNSNNDISPHYPSSYDLANIIAVAATTNRDEKASFSSFGATSVDLGAPGEDILSTAPGAAYQVLSGTSMATPHVSGVAALIRAISPSIPFTQLKNVLLTAADEIPSMAGITVTGARLNAFFAIATPDSDPPGAINDLATSDAGSNTMALSWTATGDDGAAGTASFYEVRYSTSPIGDISFATASRAGNEPAPLPSGTPQSMEVRGLDYSTTYYFAIKAFDEWGNPGAISNTPLGTTLPPPTVGLSPTSLTESLLTGQQAIQQVTLRNDGVGTLDFTIPTPFLSEPLSAPPSPLVLAKGEIDPRSNPPVTQGSGGPDPFGYRWIDSDEPGGPVFSWTDISTTGTALAITSDDSTSPAIPLGFGFPFYGTFFTSMRVCTNGWLSFTSSSTEFNNQPLPSGGAPENLVAPLFDDLNPNGAVTVRYQASGGRMVVQWTNIPRYQQGAPGNQEPGSSLTFQAILDSDGTITYQYLNLDGTLNSATVGIQDAARTTGLQVAFNQTYLHDNLAVRIRQLPQWLTVSPTSGRIPAGQSLNLDVGFNASGLDGGTYPGQIRIQNNDPARPVATVDVTLNVTGAPDADVQPTSLDFGDSFLGLPKTLSLSVANIGTDTLHVTDIVPGSTDLSASPSTFDVASHDARDVTITYTPSTLGPFSSDLTIMSDDAGQPNIVVTVTGNAIPAPVVVVDPTSMTETLFSGQTSTQILTVSNTGGSNLVVTTAADQGTGGNGLVVSSGPGAEGSGGPDAFGYRWRDSDAAGGPAFNFVDIRTTGTPIPITGDDQLSASIPMGMTFPFYGSNFTSLKVCTNGFITFDPNNTACPFTNANLPSTSLPRSSVAAFWDDLHFRSQQKARFQLDGNRFIVQFTEVDRITAGSFLTFQIQLYTDGRVQIHYLTMTSPTLNSATIGIQDQTRTIGLPVVFNAAYMHNNLAIQFIRIPDWLRVSPAGATIPPGQSADFNVDFNSTGRLGGALQGNVVLNTNIPSQPQVLVPATLNVIGAPQVGFIPTSLDYGTVFIGFPQLRSFQVVNNGTAALNVSDMDTTDPSLTIEDPPGPTASFSLGPGQARVFNLRWSPTAVGPLSASVRVHSDDPVAPTAILPVYGNAILPPVAVTSPASFTESLLAGQSVLRSLHVENQGGSDLNFSVALRALGGTPVTVHPELEVKKGEDDPRPGIDGSGGPDLFGYLWKDSDEPGGPTFSWTDISAIGTPVAGLDSDDENVGPVAIGFPFPFYGNTFNTVNISTNGWVSFTNTSSDLSNDPLPNAGSPENLLAAFHDDLHFRGVERARTYNDGSRFIIQFTDVDRFSTAPPSPAHLTFQIILHPNGRIVYQYLTMTGVLNDATTGIQNASRTDGLTVVFNAAYIHDALSVEFRPPADFLSVTPTGGTLGVGGSVDLDVRIDASNLIGGDYAASIDLTTNDPQRGFIETPVNLHVTGIPDIHAQPAALVFPTIYAGFSASLPLIVSNTGTDVLSISSAAVGGRFSMSGLTAPVDLAPGGSIPVTVTYLPDEPNLHEGNITIGSNDPDEATLVIPLSGRAIAPPEIDVVPGAISTALPPGGSKTKTLTIHNHGLTDLSWQTTTNIISSAVVVPGDYLALAKGEEDPRVGILGSGGPDLFGYRWKDSDEPGGPAFNWTDISGIGIPVPNISGDDQNSGPIPIGFSFPFYGNTFTEVRVVTNGWLSFTSGGTEFSNQVLPNNGFNIPENLLAVFWDDLHFRGAVRARYYNDGSRFIVQYTDVDRFSTAPPSPAHLTFQVILYPNGKIVYQYLTMSGVLNDATIGIQNAARNDGLTVVFNSSYMHDNLAIEFTTIPTWVTVGPTGGTIPRDLRQDATVTLDALGLSDGLHESTIEIASNDPYRPLVQVPVTLRVGLIQPADLILSPDPLNLIPPPPDDPNQPPLVDTVKAAIELPAGYDPHDVLVNTIKLNDTVPAGYDSRSFTDLNGNGVQEVMVKFDRRAVENALGQGPLVTVSVQGEIADQTWFRGTATIRVLRPMVTNPDGGGSLVRGQPLTISWTRPPVEPFVNVRYDVYLSRDGGATWTPLVTDLTSTSYVWTVDGAETDRALIRVIARDIEGIMGYDTSDDTFIIAGQLMPPSSVSGSIELSVDGGDVVMIWKRGIIDLGHGPADHFRILRASSPQGPFVEIGTSTGESFREPLSASSSNTFSYYKVVAVNGAGEAE